MADPSEIFGTIPTTNISRDSDDVVILNDQRYWLEIIVDDGENRTHIPNSLIEQVEIKESILHFETYAQITYHDPLFTFSNLFALFASKFGCEVEDEDEDARYRYKGSNKERLHLKMVPIPDSDDEPRLRPDIWHIQHEFSIAGISNMGSGDANNHIKLHCVDYQWNELKSKKPDKWVCGRAGGNRYRNEGLDVKRLLPYPNLPDHPNAKALKTGEGVFAAIEQADLKDHLPLIDEGQSQSQKRLVLDEKELEPTEEGGAKKFEEDVWDFGSEEHRVFASSVNGWSCVDFLEYYLAWHGSNKAVTTPGVTGGLPTQASLDPCFLVLERPKNENAIRKYSLKSLIHYFENAGSKEPGEYHRENFFIADNQGFDPNAVFNAIRSPLGAVCGEIEKGITSRETTTIEDYQSTPVEGGDSRDYLRTHISIYADGIDKSHVMCKSTPEQVKNYIADNYLENMKTAGDASGPENVILSLNEDKLQSKDDRTIQIQIVTKAAGVIASRNRLILGALLLNRCVNWRVKGSTHRQSGRFCGIDRLDSEDNSDFDNEILGQYFITATTHNFDLKGKNYQNELTGVKYFTYKPVEQTVTAINTSGSRSTRIEDGVTGTAAIA